MLLQIAIYLLYCYKLLIIADNIYNTVKYYNTIMIISLTNNFLFLNFARAINRDSQ